MRKSCIAFSVIKDLAKQLFTHSMILFYFYFFCIFWSVYFQQLHLATSILLQPLQALVKGIICILSHSQTKKLLVLSSPSTHVKIKLVIFIRF